MTDLTHWKPCPFPAREVIDGQWCRMEPLSVEKHGDTLWKHMERQDAVWTYLPLPPPASKAEYFSILQSMVDNTSIVPLAIIDKADGEPKGHLWIMEIRPAQGVFEVGYITYSPSMQRTRMATEAVYLIGDLGFSLGYRRYEWKCNNLNEPSKLAALRFGFTWEGLFRQHQVVKGYNRDTAWYSILDSEWSERKARFQDWLNPANFDAKDQQKKKLGDC